MNTFGKILVVCVFLMSLVAAGLCTLVVFTSTNWKKYAETNRERAEVAVRDNEPLAQTNAKIMEQYKEALTAKNTADEALKDAVAKHNVDMQEEKEKIDQLQTINLEIKVAQDKLQVDYERLQEEYKQMLRIVQADEKAKVDLHEKLTEKTRDLEMKNNTITALENRLKDINDQLANVSKNLARATDKHDTGYPTTNVGANPNQLNPPPVHVKGVIAKIDLTDKNFVQLDVGSDHGVIRGAHPGSVSPAAQGPVSGHRAHHRKLSADFGRAHDADAVNGAGSRRHRRKSTDALNAVRAGSVSDGPEWTVAYASGSDGMLFARPVGDSAWL